VPVPDASARGAPIRQESGGGSHASLITEQDQEVGPALPPDGAIQPPTPTGMEAERTEVWLPSRAERLGTDAYFAGVDFLAQDASEVLPSYAEVPAIPAQAEEASGAPIMALLLGMARLADSGDEESRRRWMRR